MAATVSRHNVKALIAFFCLCAVLVGGAQAQRIWLPDRPGRFEGLVDRDLSGGGADERGAAYAWTRAESADYGRQLQQIVDRVGTTPVLADPRGFDWHVHAAPMGLDSKTGYGMASQLYFLFEPWQQVDGKVFKWTTEPPQWHVYVNVLDRVAGAHRHFVPQFYQQPPTPGFNQQRLDDAARELNRLFVPPGVRRIVQPGVDRYGQWLFLYDPQRPDYWLPVSIREVFQLTRNYLQADPDESAKQLLELLQREWEQFSPAQREGPAYADTTGRNIVSEVSSDAAALPMMRVNPAYWNKALPRSAVQCMVMQIHPGRQDLQRLAAGGTGSPDEADRDFDRWLDEAHYGAKEGGTSWYPHYRVEFELGTLKIVRQLQQLIR